jgi:hypothetical protein
MGLFDKFTDAASKMKSTIDEKRAEAAQKKAEANALDAEFKQKAKQKSDELTQHILEYGDDSNGGFYSVHGEDKILAFTKEFYDKILLPANSVKRSYISMYPYLNDKNIKSFIKEFPSHGASEKDVFHLKDPKKQEFLLTTENFYFKVCLEENEKYFAMGCVPCKHINTFSLEKAENEYIFKCDTFELAKLPISDNREEDFITLDNYFKCIETGDFEITDEEVDELIRKKIGEKVYADVKKYMVYDDELIMYFAWGLDSLTAKDYIVCTNKQIIILDREAFGATANVKQLYYEDITAMSTNQNSKSNDLTGYLLDTALTAWTNTCELVINFAGGEHKINTLYKPEAERVIAIFHQSRKKQKEASAQPTVIQQAAQPDALDQLKKLADLKAAGILDDEEFAQKKKELLAQL